MSNNGFVSLKKTMKPTDMDRLLSGLNERLFLGNLKVEYHRSTKEEPGWGKHTWLVSYESQEKKWAERICWMDSGRKLTMRHGGGSDFAWWLDAAILNEVSVVYDGIISDEGISDKWKGEPEKYDDWPTYRNLLKCDLYNKPPEMSAEQFQGILALMREWDAKTIPPEFLKQIKYPAPTNE